MLEKNGYPTGFLNKQIRVFYMQIWQKKFEK